MQPGRTSGCRPRSRTACWRSTSQSAIEVWIIDGHIFPRAGHPLVGIHHHRTTDEFGSRPLSGDDDVVHRRSSCLPAIACGLYLRREWGQGRRPSREGAWEKGGHVRDRARGSLRSKSTRPAPPAYRAVSCSSIPATVQRAGSQRCRRSGAGLCGGHRGDGQSHAASGSSSASSSAMSVKQFALSLQEGVLTATITWREGRGGRAVLAVCPRPVGRPRPSGAGLTKTAEETS